MIASSPDDVAIFPTMHSVAQAILESGCLIVKSKPVFTWTSGIESPIYCDLRLIISQPKEREILVGALVQKIKKLRAAPDIIAGTATAGIPWAAWVAAELKLPMLYVRTKAKLHGATRQIEGGTSRGKKVVLIEDMITTGLSSLAAVEALRGDGGRVIEIVSILSYGTTRAAHTFSENGLSVSSLLEVSALLEVAVKLKRIAAATAAGARAFIETL